MSSVHKVTCLAYMERILGSMRDLDIPSSSHTPNQKLLLMRSLSDTGGDHVAEKTCSQLCFLAQTEMSVLLLVCKNSYHFYVSILGG